MRLCKCFLLILLLCVQLCACMYINVKKTITFHVGKSERENMMFFPTIEMDGDGPRDVQSVCRDCSMRLGNERWDARKKTLTVSINIHWFFSGEPWLYGRLKICQGDKDMFRQFPITLRSKSNWNCKEVTPKLMAPDESAMEALSLGIYTWFMSRKNYDDLRLQGGTELLVPLLPDESYHLPVYLTLFHEASREDGVKCTLQRPYVVSPVPLAVTKQSSHVWHYTKHLTKMMFKVESVPKKSGTYTVKCQGKYYYQPEDIWLPLHTEKHITLRFEKVPRIELTGTAGNTIFFPHSNETGVFYIDIYSTSDIVNVHMTRSDGIKNKASVEILFKFISHYHYQLPAKYRVTLPWLDNSITGLYTITAHNKQEESAKLEIRLHRVDELVVLVNSAKSEAEEGSAVSFHCLVLTDLPANTTVKWEYGTLNKGGLIESKELSVGGDRKAAELTFHAVSLTQSGAYTCVADNGFQRVEKTVTLVVYHPGTLNYKAGHKATWMERMTCDEVLDVETVNTMKTAAKVVVVILIIILVLVATAVGALVGWKVYQWLQQRRQTRSESDHNTDSDTQPLLGPSEKERESQGKEEDEVESELAELLQSMDASQAHSPSTQEKGKTMKLTAKSKKTDVDEKATEVANNDEELLFPRATKKKKRLTTTDERDELVQKEKRKRTSDTAKAGSKDEKRKKPSNTAEPGNKDERGKKPSDTAEAGSKGKESSETVKVGSKREKTKKPSDIEEAEGEAKEATKKSRNTENRKGKDSGKKNKREK